MKGMFKRLTLLAATIAATAFLLSGCSDGKNGIDGKNGVDLTTGTIDAGKLTTDDLKNVALDGKIISASLAGDQPVVDFQVLTKASRKGVSGLRVFSLHVAQLKPEAGGANSYWQNYISDGLPLTSVPAFAVRTAPTVPVAPAVPSADAVSLFNTDGTVKAQGYTVVDHGDGTYTATFGAKIKENTKVAYDATLTHRIAVGVRGVNVPGVVGKTAGAYAGPVDPLTGSAMAAFTNTNGAALVYDFVPSTGAMLVDASGNQAFARDIVTIAACNQCHYKLEYGTNNTSGHFGSRPDTKLCVICHTPQLTGGTGDFTSFMHKIHMGEELPTAATDTFPGGFSVAEFKFPMDQRNCTVCHKGTDVDNWKTKPSVKACGSCHSAINFATGVGHTNGIAVDGTCNLSCHSDAKVIAAHATNDSTPNNLTTPAGLANFTYDVSSATVNSSKQPVITFTIKKDGSNVTLDSTPSTRRLPLGLQGFKGGPTLRTFFSVTQDGITSPADFNASISASLVNLWNGLGGTLVQNADGSFTATVTGTVSGTTVTAATVPTTAKMVTALVYGNFTQSAGFASYSTGKETSATYVGTVRNTMSATKVFTGSTARRAIVSNALCNKCHEQLGIKPSFHSGGRNDAPTCAYCHTPNGTSSGSGWSYGSGTFVHAIHGASKRSKAYTFAEDWSGVGYPGLLKNCEQCHLPGTYDFSATASSGAFSKLLFSTVATGTIAATTTSPAPAGIYGSGFSYSSNTGITTTPAATTLVNSPISSACYSCHDTSAAKAHMVQNGGAIYEARSTALTKSETCLVCHGAVSSTNINNATAPTIKGVHSWW